MQPCVCVSVCVCVCVSAAVCVCVSVCVCVCVCESAAGCAGGTDECVSVWGEGWEGEGRIIWWVVSATEPVPNFMILNKTVSPQINLTLKLIYHFFRRRTEISVSH